MTDRIVVLRSDDPFSFVADACVSLAAAVNEPHAWTAGHAKLVATYAGVVRAYAALLRPAMACEPHGEVRLRIVDHLLERLGQAERGERLVSVADVADRLHGELVNEPALG